MLDYKSDADVSPELEKTRNRIAKEDLSIIFIENDDSSIVIYGESKSIVFRTLCYMQDYRLFRPTEIFIAELGIVINFSAENIRKGWRAIFRKEIQPENIVFKKRRITFDFNVEINRIFYSLRGVKKNASKGFLEKGGNQMFASFISQKNFCQISFDFSRETAECFLKLIYLPSFQGVKIEKI